MRFTFVACFASKVGDIGMVGVEIQTLEFFVTLYLKPYAKAIISMTQPPFSLYLGFTSSQSLEFRTKIGGW